MTEFRVPLHTNAAHLHLLARVAEPKSIHEGHLMEDISIRTPIRLSGRFRDGHEVTEDFTSAPVTRIEDGWALTDDCIYQFVRVPGPVSQPAPEKPEITTPRTTVPRTEYFLLRDSLFAQLEALAPELAYLQAFFRLHAEQFHRVRRDLSDDRTCEPLSAVNLHREFSILQDALCFRFSSIDQRDERERNLWIAGHKVLAALTGAVELEAAFLSERGQLVRFTGGETRLFRALAAWKHFAALVPEGVCE
jgi:hypothetical protein